MHGMDQDKTLFYDKEEKTTQEGVYTDGIIQQILILAKVKMFTLQDKQCPGK